MALSSEALAQTPAPLGIRLEARIPLDKVKGRIDHMAFDPARRRLFVAELGNDTVGVVDVEQRRVAHVIRGLSEPQGVAFVAQRQMLLVANAGDGSVRAFDARAEDYREIGHINLGSDADNIRLDQTDGRAFVGYGSGALAILDMGSLSKRASITLKAHPESFQLSTVTGRAFVNVPQAKEIAVVDLSSGRQIASWPMTHRDNFPMALDEEGQRVLVVFRSPPLLEAFSMGNWSLVASLPVCADADDLFFDARRRRAYVSCGAGFLDVFESNDAGFRRLAQIPTAPGARTSLYVAELDRLFIAAPARSGAPAAILIFTLG